MAKYIINESNIEFIFYTDKNVYLYFESGKFLTLPSYEAPKDFYNFSDKIYVNLEKVLYVKNNSMENKKTPKITIVMPSKELYCKYKNQDEMWKVWKDLTQKLKG